MPQSKNSAIAKPWKNRANPMLNIMLMVGVAISVFVAFMVYSLHTSVKNSERLTTIKELYFPILERVDANIVRIDKMEERFMQAVMTGEQDELNAAAQHFQMADAVFTEMRGLYPSQQAAIQHLQQQLAGYFGLGRDTSLAVLQRHTTDEADLPQRMNQSLSALRASVQHFRAESYAQFVHTLKASQQAASLTLYMGIAVGIMNLFFMAVLVYFIRNNFRMMAVIAEQNATLEQRVAERTAELSRTTGDLHAMLDNMTLGVCTLVQGSLIHPEYSAQLGLIVGESALAGRSVHEALFAHAVLGVDLRDQLSVALEAILGEDRMMFECNAHLLLRDMQLEWPDGSRKSLQLDWNPISNGEDVVEKVLLIVQDVTRLRTLEQASTQQREELDIIARLIRLDADRFADFVRSAQALSNDNRRLIDTTLIPEPETLAALFRNMHTIKGNARSFEFNLITDAAHEAEQTYDRLRKDADFPWPPELLRLELEAVAQAIQRYVEVSEDKLGRKATPLDAALGLSCPVNAEDLADIQQQAQGLSSQAASADWVLLARKVARLGMIHLEPLIRHIMSNTATVAEELGKPPPRCTVEQTDLLLSRHLADVLGDALMHVVRNALDHGIEPAEERLTAAKPVKGHIHFACRRVGHRMQLCIRDDGRGLALHKLLAKAREQGQFNGNDLPGPMEVANMVFHSGVSTAERLSRISGRGVGMDAARTLLRTQGGDLEIKLLTKTPAHAATENKLTLDAHPTGAFDYTPFEFIIHLPDSDWSETL
ncbi:MAG: Hpt domain-containing protein [Methylococcaceae bacterium]